MANQDKYQKMTTIGSKVLELRAEIKCSKLSVTSFWGDNDQVYTKPEDIIITCMNTDKDCYHLPCFNLDNCYDCKEADGGNPIS